MLEYVAAISVRILTDLWIIHELVKVLISKSRGFLL